MKHYNWLAVIGCLFNVIGVVFGSVGIIVGYISKSGIIEIPIVGIMGIIINAVFLILNILDLCK